MMVAPSVTEYAANEVAGAPMPNEPSSYDAS
jgi:hypothetical protein